MNWKSVLKRLQSSSALPPLPESFIFGVAMSDHQCEAYQAEREDIRDVWERERGLTRRGKATNFEEHFEEDIGLAQKLGCTAFRFSVAWSRVEPSPGHFDDAMFDYYRRLVTAIHNAGMEPVLTLHHFTWPVHVEQRGGMIADDFPTMFAHYTAEVVARLGKEVRYWITFNEPSQLVYGYIKPWWEPNYFVPPGLPEGATLNEQVAAIGKLIRNLFVAHTEARKIIRRGNPDAQVGANPLLLGLPIWLQRLLNKNATRIRSYADLQKSYRRYIEPRQLERGAVDFVIAALTHTPERERQVMFSQDYFVAGQRLLVKSSSTITGAQDLASKVVAVVKGSTAEHSITTLMPEARVFSVRDYTSALQVLAGAQADAILADDIILQGLIERHPDQYKLIGDQLTTEHYAIAVTQGHHQLLDVVDVVVRRFKNSGAWAECCARHLGQVPETPKSTVRALSIVGGPEIIKDASRRFDVPEGPLPLAPPGTALRRIQDRGYFIVAVREDMPGLSYRDPHTGELGGLEIDLAREMAKQIFGDASKIQFRPARAHERISLLHSPLHFLSPFLKPYTIFSTILVSNWWHLGMAGKLAEFLCPKECVGQQDFVGLDYYWGIRSLRLDRLQRLIDAGMGRFDRAPVWPNALYGHLRYQASLFPDLPLLIAENGSVDVADGVDRATYIRQHIEQVLRAVRDGVNVVGYICWSITSNREWGYPFDKSSDFGLYHIELDKDPDLKRVPTPATAVYKEIIAQRGVHRLAPRQHKTERKKTVSALRDTLMKVLPHVRKDERTLLVVVNFSTGGEPRFQWLYEWMDANAVVVAELMMKPHYRHIDTLTGDNVTSSNFVNRIISLAQDPQTKALDVFLNLHGSPGTLHFDDGSITSSDLKNQLQAANLNHRLRLLYSTACYGANHAPDFVEAGFRVASGAVGVNANQLYDYPLQLYHWGTNKTYESAVKAGNNPALMKMQDTLASAFFGDEVNSGKIIEGNKHTRISSEAI